MEKHYWKLPHSILHVWWYSLIADLFKTECKHQQFSLSQFKIVHYIVDAIHELAILILFNNCYYSSALSIIWSCQCGLVNGIGHPRHIEAIFTQRRNHSKISPPAVSDNVFNMWTYTIIRMYAIPNDFNLKCSMSHLILFSFTTPTALCIKTYMSSFHGVWDRECVSTITAKVFLGKSRQLLRKTSF